MIGIETVPNQVSKWVEQHSKLRLIENIKRSIV